MKKQTKYFISGAIFLTAALISVTFAPKIIPHAYDKTYLFFELEFFLLAFCSVLYLFSPKYYTSQMLTFIIALLFYILFVRLS